jgi:predicted TIM-barrel fold metal-dependent hydrolase
MGFIDAHVHVWTPDTAHYPLAAGYRKADMRPPSFTPEQLFKHTKPAGVDRVNLIQMSYYVFENELTI